MNILEQSINWNEIDLVPKGEETFTQSKPRKSWEEFSGRQDFGNFELQDCMPLEGRRINHRG